MLKGVVYDYRTTDKGEELYRLYVVGKEYRWDDDELYEFQNIEVTGERTATLTFSNPRKTITVYITNLHSHWDELIHDNITGE